MKTEKIENTVSKLIQTVAGGSVEVVFQGSGYSAGPNDRGGYVVQMASIPENADDVFIAALDGYAMHESAHILYSEFVTIPNPVVKSLANVIEDYRIERDIKAQYQGSRKNIDFANHSALNSIFKNETSDEFTWASAALASSVILNSYQDWADDHMLQHVETVNKAAGGILKSCLDIKSTQEAIAKAEELYEAIKDYFEESEEEKDGGGNSSDGSDNDSDEDSADSNSSASNEKTDGTASDQSSDVEEESDNTEKSESTEQVESSDASESSEESPEEGEEGQGKASGSGEGSDSDSDSGNVTDDAQEAKQADESDSKGEEKPKANLSETNILPLDYRQQAMQELVTQYQKQLRLVTPKQPRPFTRKYDRYIKQTMRFSNPQIDVKARQAATKLSAIIKNQTYSYSERGLTSGRLDTQNLHRIITDGKVCKVKHLPKTDFNICFVVGVDVSSSMPQYTAKDIMSKVFDVLQALGVPFEVFTYTNALVDSNYHQQITEGTRLDRNNTYTRYLPIEIQTIKEFNEPANIRRNYVFVGSQDRTPTPEAYEHAHKLLSKRTEQRRVFINVTDGEPTDIYPASRHSLPLLKNLMAEFKKDRLDYLNIGYNVKAEFRLIDKNALVTNDLRFFDDFTNAIKNIFLKRVK